MTVTLLELALALAALAFSSAVFARQLALRRGAPRLLGIAVLAYAQAILVAQGLSIRPWMTADSLVVAHLLIAVIAGVMWHARKRKQPAAALAGASRSDARGYASSRASALAPLHAAQLRRVWQLIRGYPPLLIASLACLVSLATAVFLVLFVPPNTWDAMTCHLARAAFWIQYRQVADFPSHNVLHNAYPRGASILQMYALIFIRGDYLAGFVQLLAWVGSIVAMYALGRELRFRPSAALLAALIAALTPQFVLQSTSTQIDLLFAFTLVAALYFMLRAARGGDWGSIVLAGCGVGVMLATKSTALLYGPLFLVLSLVALAGRARKGGMLSPSGVSMPVENTPEDACRSAFRHKRLRRNAGRHATRAHGTPRIVLRFALVGAPLAALLGAESYIDNILHPVGRIEDVTPLSLKRDPMQARCNLIRCGVDAFELPFETCDLTPDKRRIPLIRTLGRWLHADVDDTSERRAFELRDVLYRTVQEDVSWYGLAGFVLLPAATLGTLARGARRGPRRWAIAALCAAAFYCTVAVGFMSAAAAGALAALLAWLWRERAAKERALRWFLATNVLAIVLVSMAIFTYLNSIQRYLLPPAALAAPLAAMFLTRSRWAGRLAGFLAAAVSSVQMVDVHLHNERKPLVASIVVARIEPAYHSVLDLPRERRRAIVRAYQCDMARALDRIDPPVTRIAYVSRDGDSWDFPFFGEHLQRELVLLDWRGDWLGEARRRGLDYVVLMNVPYAVPPDYSILVEYIPNQYAILVRRSK